MWKAGKFAGRFNVQNCSFYQCVLNI